MEKRLFMLLLSLCCLLFASPVAAGNFHFIKPEILKQNLDAGKSMVLIDIQGPQDFDHHHIPGALATYAYPVKTSDDRKKLEGILLACKGDNAPVIIICPRGGGGAQRAYTYLKSQGIQERRLAILENGQQGWTYPEWTEGIH